MSQVKGRYRKSCKFPWATGDIVIVKDDVQASAGQTDATVKQSAEMGKADGVQGGERQADVPKGRSERMTGSSQTD